MIDEKIDTGKIILQRKCSISDTDDVGDLHDRLMLMSESIVVDTVDMIEQNKIDLIPQEVAAKDIELRPAPKIFKENCKIPSKIAVAKAYNLIRGLSPYPASFLKIVSPTGEEFIMKVFKTQKIDQPSKVGEIYTDGKKEFEIGFSDGRLRVLMLQLQSKKRMAVGDFLRGFSINNDWKWA